MKGQLRCAELNLKGRKTAFSQQAEEYKRRKFKNHNQSFSHTGRYRGNQVTRQLQIENIISYGLFIPNVWEKGIPIPQSHLYQCLILRLKRIGTSGEELTFALSALRPSFCSMTALASTQTRRLFPFSPFYVAVAF